MGRIVALGMGVLLAAGCVASSTQVGPGMFAIDCKKSRANCYEEAASVCPNGFDVVDGSEQHGGYTVGNAQVYGGKNYANVQSQTYYVPTYRGEMLVRCSNGATAQASEEMSATGNSCQISGASCGAGAECCPEYACVDGSCR